MAGVISRGAIIDRTLRHLSILTSTVFGVLMAGCHDDGAPATTAAATVVIGGSIVGIAAGGRVTLTNNGVDAIVVTRDGRFAFPTRMVPAQSYAVAASPVSQEQACTVFYGRSKAASPATSEPKVICGPAPRGSFEPAASPPPMRARTTLIAQADGSALNFGGDDGSSSAGQDPIRPVSRYDPASDRWTTIGSLSAIDQIAAVVATASGQVVTIPNDSASGSTLVPFVVDPATGTNSASTPARRLTGHVVFAVALVDGRIMVYDGTTVEIYRPETGEWTIVAAPLPAESSGSATLVGNGNVLFLASQTHVFDVGTGRWSTFPPPLQPRSFSTLVSLPDGRVLAVCGGRRSVGFTSVTEGAEIFDAALGTWAPAGSFGTPRIDFTVTVMPSGRVLLVGGVARSFTYPGDPMIPRTEDSVQAYDPATNTWAPFGRLLTSRTGHAATLLASGKLLVVGGSRTIPIDGPLPGQAAWTEALVTASEIGW